MQERSVKVACRHVWKLYGPQAERFLARRSVPPGPEELRAAGLIGAVRDVSLEVREGEIFVIMGLSGSGKSTLIRCLSRLVEPTAGEILFNGRDLLRASEAEMIGIRRHKIGMVFQHFALLPHLSVLQNVAFPLEVQGIDRARREARAREVIALVGLEGREGNFPRELSGGQQQRVGIARSLAAEPELWFLDEPFSALDPLIRREMQDEFLRVQRLLKKTIVFITHDFDEAIRLADRIAIMQDGAVIQTATPEELVLRPATDYVAEFTRFVPRAKVVTLGSVMRPGLPAGDVAGTLQASDRIEDVADRVEGAALPHAVADAEGRVVGHGGRAGGGGRADRPEDGRVTAARVQVPWLWAGLIALSLLLPVLIAGAPLPGWVMAVPDALRIDMAGAVRRFMDWLVEDAAIGPVSFRDVTRSIAWVIDQPYQLARALLVDGWVQGRGQQAVQIAPPLAWTAVVFVVAAMGHYARSWPLALFVGACFVYLAVFGQWAARWSRSPRSPSRCRSGWRAACCWASRPIAGRLRRALKPVLDLMQTVPIFAYLVPILFLFGFGPVAALVATVIYAMPPMVRVTTLALRQVPEEIVDSRDGGLHASGSMLARCCCPRRGRR
jgi:glycine betaine/proline transport system ATP-binding protein